MIKIKQQQYLPFITPAETLKYGEIEKGNSNCFILRLDRLIACGLVDYFFMCLIFSPCQSLTVNILLNRRIQRSTIYINFSDVLTSAEWINRCPVFYVIDFYRFTRKFRLKCSKRQAFFEPMVDII
jgi:hypothetical protein